MNGPIDAVITWVDGYDAKHQQKLNHYLTTHGLLRPESAAATRFNQCGEIGFCVRAILHFAPWIRTIHIVTDNQTPDIIKELSPTFFRHKLNIVDHQVIFAGFTDCLPTFNSLTIESVLWRIPNLAEHFIYFNDDCFLIRPVKPEDFFRNSAMVMRGSWKTFSDKRWRLPFMRSKPVPPHRLTQEKSAKCITDKRHYFYLEHLPFALKKSTMAAFFEQHPQIWQQNLVHRFRHPTQIWSVSVAYHWAFKHKQALVDNTLHGITIHSQFHSKAKILRRLQRAKAPNVAFLCLQSLDTCQTNLLEIILNWLNERIPHLGV